MKKLKELDYYNMTPEEKIRWHVQNDCTCGFLEHDEYFEPHGHYTGCPMRDENCDAWNYIYWYDCVPS